MGLFTCSQAKTSVRKQKQILQIHKQVLWMLLSYNQIHDCSKARFSNDFPYLRSHRDSKTLANNFYFFFFKKHLNTRDLFFPETWFVTISLWSSLVNQPLLILCPPSGVLGITRASTQNTAYSFLSDKPAKIAMPQWKLMGVNAITLNII